MFRGDIGSMNKACPHCQALRFVGEKPGMCCSGGTVFITSPELPNLLKNLMTCNHSLSRHFLDNCKVYNGLHQMTSFGAKSSHPG